MFVGRKNEQKLLLDELEKKNSSILLYGRRRVGKTTLIKKVLTESGKDYLYYECTKESLQRNIDAMAQEAYDNNMLPGPASFTSIHSLLKSIFAYRGEVTIIIDEYPYLKVKEDGDTVDSLFQKAIDSFQEGLHLILAGSHIGMMKDLTREGNALFGRFSLSLELKELSYLEAQEFYPLATEREKVAYYSVFGGSPLVNSEIRPDLSFQENLCRTILNRNSIVNLYAREILLTDVSDKLNADSILSSIGNGKKHYSEIESDSGIKKNGNLNKNLQTLINLDVLERRYPINKPDDAKKVLYEIKDNLMRFYYTYLFRNRNAFALLSPEDFFQIYVKESLFKTFIPLRFESIAKEFLRFKVRKGLLEDVVDIGSYYYDDKATRTNGEFDVAVRHFDGECSIVEVKYLASPMTASMIETEEEQARRIKGLRIRNVGFISISGFENDIKKSEWFFTAHDIFHP